MRTGRWFPGYTVAGVATVAYLASAPGQTFVVSQFNTAFREGFAIEPLTLNAAYTVATVLASLPLPLVGRVTDRVGPRRTLAAVAFAFGLACLYMAALGTLAEEGGGDRDEVNGLGAPGVFLGFFLLRLLGMGSMVLVSQHAVAMWFHRRLGSVHGVKQVVVFGLWILFPQMTVAMIEGLGWRWAYAVFGVGIWLAVIPPTLALLRDRPEELGLRPDNDESSVHAENKPRDHPGSEPGAGEHDAATETTEDKPTPGEAAFTLGEAARTRAYWTLTAAFFLPPMIGTAMLFDMQPILAGRGLSAGEAAAAVSVWTASMCIMALPAGMLTDRLPARVLVPLGLLGIGSSSLLLWAAATVVAAGAAAAFFGVGQSLVMASGTAAVARYFGRAHHGAIRGSVTRVGVFGTGLGPLATGLSAELTGGYFLALAFFAAICLPVALVATGLRAPSVHAASRPSGRG